VTCASVVLVVSACNSGDSSGGSDSGAQPQMTHHVGTQVTGSGSVTPGSMDVENGSSAEFDVMPDSGYAVSTVEGCGGELESGVYTIPSVTSDCTVSAEFVPEPYDLVVRYVVGSHEHDEYLTAERNGSVEIPIPKRSFFGLDKAEGCGGSVDGAVYRVEGITESCKITIQYSFDGDGSGNPHWVGFLQSERDVTAGEALTIQAHSASFSSQISSYSWEQISGPEAVYSERGEKLDVELPELQETQQVQFSVAATDSNDEVAFATITLNVYPQESSLATLYQGRSDGRGVDLVITGDGFSEDQQKLLKDSAEDFLEAMFGRSEVSKHIKQWNVHILPAVSEDSGIRKGSSGEEDLDTIFESYFWCNGIERLLCTNTQKVLAYVSNHVPQFDQVIMIANDEKYGGAGYWGANVATVSKNAASNEIGIHELGHSFALLADEYEDGACNIDGEPGSGNVTLESDPDLLKWRHWIDDIENPPNNSNEGEPGAIGHFEGGNYCSYGVWRPTETSFMRANGEPFYAVNEEQWALSVYGVAGVIVSSQPIGEAVARVEDALLVFTVNPYSYPDGQSIEWSMDGEVMSSPFPDERIFAIPYNYDVSEVSVEVSDVSGVVRSDPNSDSSATVSWSIELDESSAEKGE